MSILLFIYKLVLLCKKSGPFLRGYFPGNTFVMLRTQSASTGLTSCSFKLFIKCILCLCAPSIWGAHRGQKRSWISELEFQMIVNWPHVDAGNLPWVLCKSSQEPLSHLCSTTNCLFIFLKTRTINEPVCTSAWLCHTHPCLHWDDSLLGSTRNQSKDERPRTHAAILTWQSDADYLEPDPNDLWHLYTDS